MGSDENMCSQGNLKRKAVTGRAYQMLRLLLRTSCFEVMLNRRMPNGMYGGVRGGLNSPYSICPFWKIRQEKERTMIMSLLEVTGL